MSEENILQEADRITSSDRAKAYGPAKESFENIAEYWSSYINRKFKINVKLEDRDVSMLMILLKVSRDSHMSKRDNLVDISGYARTAEMCGENQQ